MWGRLAIPLLFIPLIPVICFRNEGWLKESLEETGAKKGAVREFIKFFPNTSLIFRR